MRARNLIYPVVVLAISGCNLVSGKCTYEIRSTDATGAISQSGSEFAAAQVTLSEQRGSIQGQSVYWLVTSTSLKGHVTSASFKDASNPGVVLLNLPLASADRPEIAQGTASSNLGANLAGFRDILVAGHGMIELQTDEPGQLTVQIVVTVTTAGDWVRPYCS